MTDTLQVIEFYAVASSALSSDTITVQYANGDTGYIFIEAFGVNGADTSSPFDGEKSLPATNANFSAGTINLPTAVVNTSATNSMLLAFWGGNNSSSGFVEVGAGAVDSVKNTDGSLTVNPTVGDVVVALNTAHANTWTASQTIPDDTSASGTTTGLFFTTNSGSPALINYANFGSGNTRFLQIQGSAQASVGTTPYEIDLLPEGANVYSSYINFIGATTTTGGLFTLNLSTANAASSVKIIHADSTGLLQSKNNTLDDGSGNITTAGWAWIKGKNRSYQQNLTASTTTATTATLLGTSIAFTPKFSGYLVVSLTVRANNNTIGDGVTIGLYQGASSGALTTLLDSETYTQEGLASNSETFVLHYELSGQTVGTATYISAAFNAVTGGTASAKIVALSVQEAPPPPPPPPPPGFG